jgi:hypothetical protein
MPIIVHVTTNLPTYVPKHFDHQPPNGGQPRDSPGSNSPKRNPPGKPPFNPHVASFGWPAPNPHMFRPPWY